MPNWTREQRQAIEAENHTILVSAAAGSGKTAVLIERVVSLLRKGYRLDRMLIVTFTRAAASEMRERLTRRLTREARLHPDVMGQALDDLESCEISTIHAFCIRVLRNDFQAVGVDPMFRICEENDRQALFEMAFVDAMNDLLPADPEVLALTDAFGQEKVRAMCGSLYTFLMSMPEPFRWLDEKIGAVNRKPYEDHPWYLTLANEAKRRIEGMGDLLAAQEQMFHVEHAVEPLRDTWQADHDAYLTLLQRSKESTRAFYEALASFGFVRAASCRGLSDEQEAWKKRYTDLRNQMKKLVATLAENLAINEPKLTRELSVMTGHLQGLSTLIKRVHELFFEYKKQKNVLDFADLEQLTCDILRQDGFRQRLQAEYDHIFVDECQDVSAIQDEILQAVHGEKSCLFMVGDVKQSIYRFRLADPTRFLHRMRAYSDDPAAMERRIFLQKNFRSQPRVLDATNRVFRHLMREQVTELNYLPEDELIPGRETDDGAPVEIHVIDTETAEDEEKVTSLEAEAGVLIERMRELLQTPFRDGDTIRLYTYRDMVVLLPKTSGVGARLMELLTERGVPVYFDGADNYFDLPEIVAVKSLLSVIDNPLQDVPLMAALKATPFGMTDADLAAIRLCKMGRGVPFSEAFEVCRTRDDELGRRCAAVAKQLADWRFQAENTRLSDFLWSLLRTSGFYASCGALPKGELRQANLRLLCQRAAEYEANGGETLSGFLDLAEQQRAADDQRSAKTLGEGENLVRIMTMHKSKGLEFPVVFCLQLSGKLHKAYTSDINLHSGLGVSLPYVNRPLNIRRRTMADAAFAERRLLDEKAERARLLYVAMTRARERLILVGCTPEKKRSCWFLPESDDRIGRAESMTDWLMQAVLTEDPGALGRPNPAMPWTVTLRRAPRLEEPEATDSVSDLDAWLTDAMAPRPGEELPNWDALEQPAPAAPLKTSVSSLTRKQAYHDPLPLSDEEESPEEKRQQEIITVPLRMSELPSKPAFLQEKRVTGAELGTLTHRLLSLLPLEAMRVPPEELPEALRRETHAMVERGQLAAKELLMLPLDRVADFYRSDLGSRALRSPTVRREWSFNLRLEDGETLLQGVIDCAFLEDGRWVVVDYKTDHIQDEDAFVERYTEQLRWYGRALARITGLPVAERWLYALEKRRAYAIPE